jgi:hypothetical protein
MFAILVVLKVKQEMGWKQTLLRSPGPLFEKAQAMLPSRQV